MPLATQREGSQLVGVCGGATLQMVIFYGEEWETHDDSLRHKPLRDLTPVDFRGRRLAE
jgi:hypothetical protein